MWKSPINVMAFPIAMTAATNWDVLRLAPISATWRNTIAANRLVSVYQSLGTAMALTTALITLMRKTAARYLALRTFLNAITQTAFSNRIFAMVKMIVVMAAMRAHYTLAFRLHLSVLMANGSVPE